MNYTPIKERFFEMIDGKLFVFGRAISTAGLSTNYYWKERSNNNKRLEFLDHPENKNFVVVGFETMSKQHQDTLNKAFTNPYDLVVRQPILKMIELDDAAEKFFIDHRYEGKSLPLKRIKQYSRAASILNFLKKVADSKNKLIKEIGIKFVPNFYTHLIDIIKQEQQNGYNKDFTGKEQLAGNFPNTQRFLMNRLDLFIKNGYECLIDKMYGNTIAAKISDEVCEAKLLSLLNDGNQQDDVYVCMMYNMWAKANDYKMINPGTVGLRKGKTVFI